MTAPAGPHGARDRLVLALTARGLPRPAIARHLGVCDMLVSESMTRLRAAYGAANGAHVVACALACGDLRCSRCRAPRVTARQRAVLALVAAGLSHAECAARLGVGAPRVQQHVCRLNLLFGTRCRAQLVAEAYRCGLLVADPDGPGLILAGGAP